MFIQSLLFFIISTSIALAVPLPTFRLLRSRDPRIVGGNVSDIISHPYTISLQSGSSHICGGSIISSRYVLTAAHCTNGASANRLAVRVGSSYHNKGGTVIKVKSITQHPKFDMYTIDWDYSLLELSEDIEFDATKKAIELPQQDRTFDDGTMLVTIGWGMTQNVLESRDKVRNVSMPIVNQDKCAKAYSMISDVTPRMICAGYPNGGKDACQGLVNYNLEPK
jgi:trypsin